MSLNESIVHEAALEWIGGLGYGVECRPLRESCEPETESFGLLSDRDHPDCLQSVVN